jgi:hypothetical protein
MSTNPRAGRYIGALFLAACSPTASAPLGVNEFFLGFWLLARGFTPAPPLAAAPGRGSP